MNASAPSLLTFLDAPIVVGDPQGCVTYVNPAFESRFLWSAEEALGCPLSHLFEGGTRESVLHAVAAACQSGRTERFRIRHEGHGFNAVASPINAQGQSIGVVILLSESAAEDERCLALHRALDEPMAELSRSLDELLEATGGRRSERYRSKVEDGMRSLARLKQTNLELRNVLTGNTDAKPVDLATLDVHQSLKDASARVREKFAAAGVELEVLVPGLLPRALGVGERLTKALIRLLDVRLHLVESGDTVTLAARATGRGEHSAVVVTIVDSSGPDATADTPPPDDTAVEDLIRSVGGDVRTSHDSFAGITTAIRLQTAPGRAAGE